jgi:hypothetical protein
LTNEAHVLQQIAVQRRIPVDVYFFNLTLRVFVARCDGEGALAALDQMVGTRYYHTPCPELSIYQLDS